MRNSDARSRKNIVVTYTKERSLFLPAVLHAQLLSTIQQKQWSFDHSAKSRLPFYQRNYGHTSNLKKSIN